MSVQTHLLCVRCLQNFCFTSELLTLGTDLNFSFCSYTREQEIRWKWIFGPHSFLAISVCILFLKNVFKKCFELRNQCACPTCEKLWNPALPSRKEHLISGMRSPNKRVLSYARRAEKQNYSLDRGRTVARDSSLPQDRVLQKHAAINI